MPAAPPVRGTARVQLIEGANDTRIDMPFPSAGAQQSIAAQFNGGPEEAAYTAGLDVNRRLVQRWSEFLNASRTGHDPLFAPWQAYAAIPSKAHTRPAHSFNSPAGRTNNSAAGSIARPAKSP